MDRIKREDYKNTALTFLITSVLLYAGLYVPFVLIAAPFLLVYCVARYGAGLGGAAAVLSFAAAAYFDLHTAGVLAGAFLPSAFVTGYMIRAKKRFFNSVAASCAAALAGAAVIIAAVMLLTGKPFIESVVDYAGRSFASLGDQGVSSLYQAVRYADILTGAITQEAVLATSASDAVKIMQGTLSDTLNLWLITIIGLYSLLGGLLFYTIPRAIVKKSIDVAHTPSFSDYALPKGFWIAFALSYAFAAVGASFGWKSFNMLELTVINIYFFVFIVQALSFFDYMYKKRNMSAGARTMLHVLSVLALSFILFLIGIIENIFSIRKKMDEREV